MLISGIKSRPVYAPLTADPAGTHHVFAAHGSGVAAVRRVLPALGRAAAGATVILVPGPARDGETGEDLRPAVGRLAAFGSEAEAVGALGEELARCHMGTRLYLAGPEGFVGSCEQVATRFGMRPDEVQREHCGTLARRVFCTHCHRLTENVTTNVAPCSHCGRMLLVRDHYSRRHAAFMGVQVDAEVPGEVPPAEEIFR